MILRLALCLALVTTAHGAAGSEGLPASSGMSLFSSFLQMSLALLVVLGLILVVYYGATRVMRSVPTFGQVGRLIRVLEVRALGPRKALVLVEVGGEYLLLASTDSQLNLIKKIEMLEEIEVLEEKAPGSSFLAFLNKSSSRPA
ncbi:MAG: flagellar biosynthetic protein FliO [Geobacter sp.]